MSHIFKKIHKQNFKKANIRKYLSVKRVKLTRKDQLQEVKCCNTCILTSLLFATSAMAAVLCFSNSSLSAAGFTVFVICRVFLRSRSLLSTCTWDTHFCPNGTKGGGPPSVPILLLLCFAKLCKRKLLRQSRKQHCASWTLHVALRRVHVLNWLAVLQIKKKKKNTHNSKHNHY